MNICVDCAMAHANNDFSGMDSETELRVKSGMERTGHLVVDSVDITDFSWSQCDACDSTLGGARFGALSI
ncbi:MAG: hypothetical protein JW384_02939 [Nitrosomonadaceae bacterium]|nr:hypothetical protein [Nitrosomonadaceae bacterium]